jgi:putative flippase GtrA
MEKVVRPLRLGLLVIHRQILQVIRFGIVGAVGTAVYLTIAISLPALSSLNVSATTAAALASAISVLVSYMGHHKFTFVKVGQHDVYLPRFLLLSLVLSVSAAVCTYILTEVVSVGYRYAAAAIAVAYPIASFTLNRAIIFRDDR